MKNSVIFGVEGFELTKQEYSFFKSINPFGFILFARNIQSPQQVQLLSESLKNCVEDETVPIFVDQEGGRVRRLRSPHWSDTFAMGPFGKLYIKDKELSKKLLSMQIDIQSSQLSKLGLNGNCAPVLDRFYDYAHAIVGDRSFSNSNEIISELGDLVINRFLTNGIFPVVKHMPGHGRALVDSHHELPEVDADIDILEASDFIPFKNLNHAPMGMTAHIKFKRIDSENCATMSQHIIQDVIRNRIGFDGLLMTDDLSMKALKGSFRERAENCLQAGCDIVLHCNGDMEEMISVAEGVREMDETSWQRWLRADKMNQKLKMQLSHSEEETYSQEISRYLKENECL